jgi:hypothetical protein
MFLLETFKHVDDVVNTDIYDAKSTIAAFEFCAFDYHFGEHSLWGCARPLTLSVSRHEHDALWHITTNYLASHNS